MQSRERPSASLANIKERTMKLLSTGRLFRRLPSGKLHVQLALLALSAVLPMFVLIVYTAFEQRKLAIFDAERQVAQLSRIIADDHKQLVEGARQLLTGLGQLPSVLERNEGECSNRFAAIAEKFPNYSNLAAAAPNGDVFCSASPFEGSVNIRDRQFFLQALSSREFSVGEYVIGSISQKPTIHFAYPSLNDAGEVQAVVYAALNLTWLNEFSELPQLPSGSTLHVFDSFGTVLVHYPDPETWVGKTVAGSPLLLNIFSQRGEGSAQIAGLDGLERIYGYARLEDPTRTGFLYLAVGIPREAIVGPINADFTRNIVLLAIVTILSVVGAWLVGDVVILVKIRALTHTAKEMAKGRLGARTGILGGKGELDQLARAFDDMADKLETVHSGLEKRVSEKTWELEQEKVRDEAILFSLGEGLIVTDRQNRIVLVNRKFETLLGWSLNEVFGRPVTEVLRVADAEGNPLKQNRSLPRKLGAMTNAQVEQKNDNQGYFYTRKDDTRFPVATTITPIIFFDNEIIGAVEVFRDITEEKAVDQAKSEFVSLASHQLRTPLSTIRWYSEMLLDGDAGKLTSKQRTYTDEIYTASKRMIELVNALLNVSRIDLGTFAIDLEETNVIELAETVLEELQPLILEKHLGIDTDFDRSLPTIQADPKLLRIVLQNLLTNAVKYTPAEGSIRLTLERRGKEFRIVVSDTGYGIPEAYQDRIFTKLFRAANIRDKDPDGTGLGLYIVHSILEHAGGNISFVSKEGEGTTFTVTLPIMGMKARSGTKKIV